jgi:hypothetical protein
MDTEDFKISADIMPPDPACVTVATGDDGVDHGVIARRESLYASAHGFNDAGKLVSDDARVPGERIRAMNNMDVGTANSCPYGPQEDFAQSGLPGRGNFMNLKVMR